MVAKDAIVCPSGVVEMVDTITENATLVTSAVFRHAAWLTSAQHRRYGQIPIKAAQQDVKAVSPAATDVPCAIPQQQRCSFVNLAQRQINHERNGTTSGRKLLYFRSDNKRLYESRPLCLQAEKHRNWSAVHNAGSDYTVKV